MTVDDIVVNKAAAIERSVGRITEEYAGDPANLHQNWTKQDSIILNIQRACEASIDLAMHLVRKHKLGVPQRTRDAFDMLGGSGLLAEDLASALKNMVGFRNIAIHDYQALNLAIVQSIVERHLTDFTDFSSWALTRES